MINRWRSVSDKATSSLLLDIDWDTTLQIVDLIRQGDITPKNAVAALTTKLNDSNPNVVLLALQVLESIVKNCGGVVHEYVATRDFMEELMELLKRSSNEEVQKRVLLLLSGWLYAFRGEPKYRAVQDTVNILKAEGHHIPSVNESDAMFTADSAPIWSDGGCCHRCRAQFTMIRRKHHCRACGQVFCSDCSSKTSTIPKFGIEREVRVCEHCHDEMNNIQKGTPKSKMDTTTNGPNSQKQLATKKDESHPNTKTAEEMQEEEELQLALALSKSEAENKEKLKMRSTDASWNQPSSPKNVENMFYDKEVDPELAKYLNRSYWEKKQQQSLKMQEPRNDKENPALSPTIPTAPNTNRILSPFKMNELTQNCDAEEVDEFVATLRSQLEIFVNRMKSNQSRGRPIANDTAVQSLFMNITAMHSQLLTYIQEQDRKRVHCEQLQDKISQIRDARAALDALREEHREKMRREKEEQERIRQIQMMQKLEIMRKKKQEYLEYQRQLALHRMAESERQILSGQQNIGGGPPVFGPISYPAQSFPTPQAPPPPVGGYMYPIPQGDAGVRPPFQGPNQGPAVSIPNQPLIAGGYQVPAPTPHQQPPSTEYLHYGMPAPKSNMNMAPPYGPPQHVPPMVFPQGMPPVDPAGVPPPSQAPPEEHAELISFD